MFLYTGDSERLDDDTIKYDDTTIRYRPTLLYLGFIYTVLQYNYHATELPLGAWPARRSAIK